MRFATVLLSALLSLLGLSTALTIGDVTRNSITAFARQEIKERSLLSDILTDIENLAECSACEVSGGFQQFALLIQLPLLICHWIL